MGLADAYNAYLQKHAIGDQLITDTPDPQLHIIIAIPAYNESGLTTCLDSLLHCDPPLTPTEVIVLINSSESSSREIVAANRRSYAEVREWIAQHRSSRQENGVGGAALQQEQHNTGSSSQENSDLDPDTLQMENSGFDPDTLQQENNTGSDRQENPGRDPALFRQEERIPDSDQQANTNRAPVRSKSQEKLRFHVVLAEDLPEKHFGAGLARKLVMDEAVRRLARRAAGNPMERGAAWNPIERGGAGDGSMGRKAEAGTGRAAKKNDSGIIISLDADTVVRRDYLREVEQFFKGSPEMEGCSISFAHPLNQQEYNHLFSKTVCRPTPTPDKPSPPHPTPENVFPEDPPKSNPPLISSSPEDENRLYLSPGNRNQQDQPPEIFPPTVFDAVINYELHQRYYLQAVRYTGYPFAYHTVGSCFAVLAETYCRMGGLSRRKAGEDFYFIQKIAVHGRYGECRTTRVYPSPRPSDRVPFGTGPDISRQISCGGGLDASAKHPNDRDHGGTGPDRAQPAVSEQSDASAKHPNDRDHGGTGPDRAQPAVSEQSDASAKQLPPYLTYNPELFEHLRRFYVLIPRLYRLDNPPVKGGEKEAAGIGAEGVQEADPPKGTKREAEGNGAEAAQEADPPVEREIVAVLEGVPAVLRGYLEKSRFWEELREISRNTASEEAFRKRFFNKFNMFWILKYLHFAEEQGTEKMEVTAASRVMLEMWGKSRGSKKRGSPISGMGSPTTGGGSPSGKGEATGRGGGFAAESPGSSARRGSAPTRALLEIYRKDFG
jgi:hypothetical protein